MTRNAPGAVDVANSITRCVSASLLLVAAAVAAADDDARLLFASAADGSCEIGLFSAAGEPETVDLKSDACPRTLLVSSDRRTAYVLVNENVVAFALDGTFEPVVVAFAPDLDLGSYLDKDIEKPHPSVLEESGALDMRVRAIDRFDNGSLGLHAALELPFGGSFDYLFELSGDTWSIVDARNCDNWTFECRFRQLEGSSSDMWSWAQEKLVWHPAVARSHLLVSDKGTFPGTLERRFEIDGARVVMTVGTFDSAHYDTVYTGELVIRWDDGRELMICNEQCHATISGGYVLAQRFWGGTLEVFDLRSGKSMLGPLQHAVWVDAPKVDYAEARGALVAAYQSGDFAGMVEASEKSLRARLEYPGGLFNLALSHALNDAPKRSLAVLERLLILGVDFNVAEMDAFAAVRELDGWAAYEAGIAELNTPKGNARVIVTLDDGQFAPEGIAVEPSGAIWLGSIHKGLLTRTLGTTEILSDRAGHWSVFGMRFARDGSLWFASAAVPQLHNAGDDEGKTGLFRYNLRSGEIDTTAVLPQYEENQLLGDLTLSLNQGDVYTTDSLTGGVYRYGIRSQKFDEIVPRGRLGSPQGLALSERGRYLYIADYIGGIYRLSLQDNRLQKVHNGSGRTDYGIDGLYFRDNELIAIQNGVRPHRVVAFELGNNGLSLAAARTLASNLPEFDEPTLGALRGDHLYFVANSHWDRFDRDNRLPEGLAGPIVLDILLAADCTLDICDQNDYSDSR